MRLIPTIVLALVLFVSINRRVSGEETDWQVIPAGGRDYLSLANIAHFYGLKIEQDLTDRHFQLGNERQRLETCKNPRELKINGVKHWLSFPVLNQDGQPLVSRFDLAKTLDPALRPTMIGNLEPFDTVVLDAGHGGQDGGGQNSSGTEKQYALQVVDAVKKSLAAKGFKVILTRYDDAYVPLEGRADFINHVTNSVFVSIHFNSSADRSADGFEVYAMTPRGAASTGDFRVDPDLSKQMPGNDYDDDSFALATCVHHSVLGHLQETDRGVKRARFAVLRLSHAPSILVEGGFLTNSLGSRRINDPAWREQLAESVALGIKSYRDLANFKQAPKLVDDYRGEQPPLARQAPTDRWLAMVPTATATWVRPASNLPAEH